MPQPKLPKGRQRVVIACLGPTCLGAVSLHAHVSSRRRVFARPVFWKCLRRPTCFRDDASLRQTCLQQVSSYTRVGSLRKVSRASAVCSGSVFGRPRAFAPRSVFARHVSSDAHVTLLSSPSMRLLTCKCLRRSFFAKTILDPMCLQNVSLVFGRCVHTLRQLQCIIVCKY